MGFKWEVGWISVKTGMGNINDVAKPQKKEETPGELRPKTERLCALEKAE